MTSNLYTKGFYDSLREGVIRSAKVMVPVVLQLIPACNVVDIGCGQGDWLAAFLNCGVADVLGIDGDHIDASALSIPPEQFRAADLSKPIFLGRKFDLAVSLEVAEHLPAYSAADFIESLTRLAPAVLFSGAIPYQGGVNHVNERWPEYWAALFEGKGYVPVDAIRRRVWQDESVEWWYAQNTILFVCPELLESDSALKAEFEQTDPKQLSRVHPRNYIEALRPIDPPRWDTRSALHLLHTCLTNGIHRRLLTFGGRKSEAVAIKNPPKHPRVTPS